MAPGEHAGWAIVDPATGQVSGGVIVCTPEVCGSGWFAGMRVVLQTLQDPVEASRASNGVGNVAGYSSGTYDFATGRWTVGGSGGAVYEIPLAYPGADQGGAVHAPVCIANCPTASPSPIDPGASADEGSGAGADTSASEGAGTAPSASGDSVAAPLTVSARKGGGFNVVLAPLSRGKGLVTIVMRKNGRVIKVLTVNPGRRPVALVVPASFRGAVATVSRAGVRSTAVRFA